MRTKGKLKKDYTYLMDSQGKVVATMAHADGLPTEQQLLNAGHFFDCWNAFEPEGLVSELAGALEKIENARTVTGAVDERLEVIMGLKEIAKQALAKWEAIK